MYLDPITTINLAGERHRARVRSATRRHSYAEATADREWSRRTTRPAVWRRARHR